MRNTTLPLPCAAVASSQRANCSLVQRRARHVERHDVRVLGQALRRAPPRAAAGWSVAHFDLVDRKVPLDAAEVVVDGFANAALFDFAHRENDDAHSPIRRLDASAPSPGPGRRLASSQSPSMS